MVDALDEVEALFVRSGDGFVATGCTQGPWHDGISGGAVLSLLGHVLEDVPTLVPMSMTRLTVDIVRPVPGGQLLAVDTEILREGKKIQVVELSIRAGDVVTTRARALRIRDRDVRGLPGVPSSSTTTNPVTTAPGPLETPGLPDHPHVAPFLKRGAELRRTPEPMGDDWVVWCRLRVPVVDGEPVRPSSLAALPLDIANLIGIESIDPSLAMLINPDVTGHLCRAPVGEWVALTGNTYVSDEVGHGVSIALMSDEQGTFGVTSMSQILDVL